MNLWDFSEITKQTEKNKIGILVKLQNKQKKTNRDFSPDPDKSPGLGLLKGNCGSKNMHWNDL
jgi:hypothetical protein